MCTAKRRGKCFALPHSRWIVHHLHLLCLVPHDHYIYCVNLDAYHWVDGNTLPALLLVSCDPTHPVFLDSLSLLCLRSYPRLSSTFLLFLFFDFVHFIHCNVHMSTHTKIMTHTATCSGRVGIPFIHPALLPPLMYVCSPNWSHGHHLSADIHVHPQVNLP